MNAMLRNPSGSSWLLMLLLFTALQLSCLSQAQDITSKAVLRRLEASSTLSTRASTTSSAPARTHTVQVGLADHKFRPDVTNAEVGDIIEFAFYPTNHSIVRAEYGYPCIPYEMTGTNKSGFFSGFNAIDKVVDNPPKYSIRVNDTAPIFFYCSALGSCIDYAMVGAINPNYSTPISTQQQLARDSAYMLNPGEPFPPESSLVPRPPGTGQPPHTNNLSDTPNPSDTTHPPTKKHDLSPGAIAGIAIAGTFVLILSALLFFFWGRTKSLKDEVKRAHSRTSSTAYMLPSPATTYQPQYPPPQQLHQQQQHQHDLISPLQPYTHLPPPVHFQHPYPHDHLYPSPPPDLRLIVPTPPQTQVHLVSPVTGPHAHSPISPQLVSPSGVEPKLGAYGNQEVSAGAAPPYGWHVNGVQGPVEMEGGPVALVGTRTRGRERARWEEVGGERGGFVG